MTVCVFERNTILKKMSSLNRRNFFSLVFFIVLLFAAWLPEDAMAAYKVISKTQSGSSVEATLQALSSSNSNEHLYGTQIPYLKLKANYETPDWLHVHITDKVQSRWEVPMSLLPRPGLDDLHSSDSASHQLELSYTENPFGFAVTRRMSSSVETLFNSTAAGSSNTGNLVFTDQYLSISTGIPKSASLYGFGESTRPAGFKLSPGGRYTLWNEDVAALNTDINLYGSHPFYMDVRENGYSHGVLLLNSNGMDVVIDENQLLTYKVTGGVLDFYFFPGPTPLKVMEQFTKLIGRPAPMPYWSLGFHQCRYGYKNVTDIETVAATYKATNIPLEVMWTDIDHMDAYKDFTLDPINFPADRLRAFVDKLHENGQKYVLIVDPGISTDPNYSTYKNGIEKDIFIKGSNGKYYLGQVWPGPVHFPDFLHPNSTAYWTNEIFAFHQTVPFDGLWTDMNEVSNFCSGITCSLPTDKPCPNLAEQTTCCLVCSNDNATRWDVPPYTIDNSNVELPLGNKTIATSATHFGGILEYDAHNLYGFSESIATNAALRSTLKKRPFVLTRSTFVGTGAYAAHWTGDNGATWNDLAYSIVSILNSGLFGIPMVGADICGFGLNTTEELCNRWIQVGAFYPFSRDHSDKYTIRQELYVWSSVAESARKALGLRYKILPYLYTLVYESHKMGYPIARPLFFHFFNDPSTFAIDTQFSLGSAILVSPVLTPNTTYVNAYFPRGTWYNLFNYSQSVTNSQKGSYVKLAAPMDTINVHLREGTILPMQEAALTTTAARKTPFTLVIAFSLSKGEDDEDSADGTLFLDDGEDINMDLQNEKSTFIEFSATRSKASYSVESTVHEDSFALSNGWVLEKLVVLGIKAVPKILK